MAITGNKGEWSEIYTLFRLLGEGKVHAGDVNLNKLNVYYPIINIVREESRKFEYKPDSVHNIVVVDANGKEYVRIPMDTFMNESSHLLQAIKKYNGKERSFSIPRTEEFMEQIGCTKLKAPSTDKSDIHIVIHDLITNMTPLLGFSIKSFLGGDPTLLNATGGTNVIYRLCNKNMTDDDLMEINSIKDHLPRMNAILEKGYDLEYFDIENQIFKNNLLFLDCCMPSFISHCLLCNNLQQSSSSLKKTVETIARKNPFGFTGKNVNAFYEHKMKVLLIAAALGMKPATEWTGRYDANGGYLVVRKDGEIVCYHFYNWNDVEDYLYNNTRFERGERKKHKYGSLYRSSDGEVYIKLNLQIRFKNKTQLQR